MGDCFGERTPLAMTLGFTSLRAYFAKQSHFNASNYAIPCDRLLQPTKQASQ